jgi:hypothetical protein
VISVLESKGERFARIAGRMDCAWGIGSCFFEWWKRVGLGRMNPFETALPVDTYRIAAIRRRGNREGGYPFGLLEANMAGMNKLKAWGSM